VALTKEEKRKGRGGQAIVCKSCFCSRLQ